MGMWFMLLCVYCYQMNFPMGTLKLYFIVLSPPPSRVCWTRLTSSCFCRGTGSAWSLGGSLHLTATITLNLRWRRQGSDVMTWDVSLTVRDGPLHCSLSGSVRMLEVLKKCKLKHRFKPTTSRSVTSQALGHYRQAKLVHWGYQHQYHIHQL